MTERAEPRGAAPRCAYCHDDAAAAEAEAVAATATGLEDELTAVRLARGAVRSDRAPAWWVLVLLLGGVSYWLWTIVWAGPARVVLDLR